jgi:transketolase
MTNWEMKLTRQGWADALIELGSKDPNVVVLDADLSKSTLTCQFKDKFPDRFFNAGIAEQNMINLAGGLSLAGFMPFVSTYGVFVSGRAWEQIRTTTCINNLNVKFGGAHGGVSVGPDGATHQALEEISIMRCLPGMTVLVPADYYETYKATLAAAAMHGPVYIRFGREKVPVVSKPEDEFIVGKAKIMREGKDVTIVACGAMVAEALDAADELASGLSLADGSTANTPTTTDTSASHDPIRKISAEVINLHTIKPIDSVALIASVKKTGAIVTAEEHQVMGGMGSAVLETLAQNYPVPAEMVGIQDTFGESGTPDELLKKYGCKSVDIIEKVKKVLTRVRNLSYPN